MGRFPSSIFSFDTVKAAGARPQAACIAVAIILVAELGLRVLGHHLGAPVVWGDGEVSSKVAQAKRLRARGEALEVLILGPSHASVGLSPKTLAGCLGSEEASVYNGGLNGRDYPVAAFVFEHVYLDELRPKTVVVTANPICFNANWTFLAHNTPEFFQAPMPRMLRARGLSRLWYGFLAEDLCVYRYRKRERKLAEGFVGGRRILDERGWHRATGVFDESARRRLRAKNHPYRNVWVDYEFGGEAVEGLRKILDLARKHRIRTVVVNMPFREELFELPGPGRECYRKYLEAMERLRGEFGFAWFDYHGSMTWSDEEFSDVDHLNELGAAKLSAELGRDLKRLGLAQDARSSFERSR